MNIEMRRSIFTLLKIKSNMESLREIFEQLNGKLIQKWDHYIEIDDMFFSKYRGREVNILEIGVSQGGSIELWKKYFGEIHTKPKSG